MLQDEPLNAEAIQHSLGNQVIGHHITVLEETTSTNDEVFHRADESAEGVVVFAEHQTAGRGQHGHRWESAPRKSLCFSILLRPKIAPNESWRITTWAAARIALVLCRNYSLGATVKATNDVYVKEQKICGVLLEMRALPGAHVGILGVGINVNQGIDDFPAELRAGAVSIAMLTGNKVDRTELAIALLRELNRNYPP